MKGQVPLFQLRVWREGEPKNGVLEVESIRWSRNERKVSSIEEMRWIQERYIKCLAAETKLTERKIQAMLKKQLDIYLSAEQAVEYGIADIII